MADFGQFIQYEFYSAMPAPNSAMKAGHSAKSQKPAGMLRIRVLLCSGMGCWLGTDSPQMRHFHQKQIIARYLTNNPKLEAGSCVKENHGYPLQNK
jgi:hypothetical protein